MAIIQISTRFTTACLGAFILCGFFPGVSAFARLSCVPYGAFVLYSWPASKRPTTADRATDYPRRHSVYSVFGRWVADLFGNLFDGTLDQEARAFLHILRDTLLSADTERPRLPSICQTD